MNSAPANDLDAPRGARPGSTRKKRRKTPSAEAGQQAKGEDPVPQQQDSDTKPKHSKKRKRNQAPLKGMIVAVSTLDVKGKSHANSQTSYKAVAELCQQLGASVTGQLHRRVSCLVCNETAVSNATQRVRKAVKKKVPIVDVAWLTKCQEKDERVNLEPYRLDDLAVQVLESRINEVAEDQELVDAVPVEELPSSAWSVPKPLGCCCVCHENGDENCPWCTDCSV